MPDKWDLADQWDSLSDETKEMARQIVKTFAEKGLTICDAKEVFRACKIYMEVNSRVRIGG